MNAQQAAEVLNSHAHREHTDWVVKKARRRIYVDIKYQVEDYLFRFTPAEADAIARKYAMKYTIGGRLSKASLGK